MKQQLIQATTGILLHQNTPNPFYPSTIISYELPAPEVVALTVLNIMGHDVKTLVHEWKEAGRHNVEFDGEGFPAGQYFYRLTVGSFTETKPMLLTR